MSRITTSKPWRLAASSARAAIASGGSPGTIGRLSTPACCASTASCSCAAGRCTSSEASSAFWRSRVLRRSASLAVVVVLPEPCRPTISTTRGGAPASARSLACAAEQLDQAVVDDLDHHLAGRDAPQHLLADRALADPGDEVLDHRQRDVGLEQRDADVAQRRLDVALAQRAAPLEAVEHGAETA